ncbi:hypothetical protein DL96DRAFT_1681902 [Flagelloscypha sp. PMI_526]|nr:hypothetical protein DL96DRAFT_1681902 [Flagelloscypha sp. PMI_526]
MSAEAARRDLIHKSDINNPEILVDFNAERRNQCCFNDDEEKKLNSCAIAEGRVEHMLGKDNCQREEVVVSSAFPRLRNMSASKCSVAVILRMTRHQYIMQMKSTSARHALIPSSPTAPLPDGFSAKLESPLVWNGKDYEETGERECVRETPWASLSIHTPTPQTWSSPARLLQRTLPRRGFFVLRTPPIDKYTNDQIATVYAGVASYVGNLRAIQDPSFTVLAHIKDLRETHPQVFHAHIGDIISLLALETAAKGGRSRIASTWNILDLLIDTATTTPFNGIQSSFTTTAGPSFNTLIVPSQDS